MITNVVVFFMSDEQPIVFVVDDDQSIRDALQSLLHTVGLEVRVFQSTQQFLQSERPDAPGCLVLDVRLPGVSGLDFQSELIKSNIHYPIVFISGHGDIPMAVEAVHKGALDFLVKPFDDEALLQRVNDAFQGDARRRPGRGTRRRSIAALTGRERQVLDAILEGKTNRAAARDLKITPKTIEYHRARIMRKLRVDSAAELFRYCLDS